MPNIEPIVLELATFLGAVSTILIFYRTNIKPIIDNKERHENEIMGSLNRIETRLSELEKYEKDNRLFILKSMVIDDKLSVEERIRAGDEYIALGGTNGITKEVYRNLLRRVRRNYEN